MLRQRTRVPPNTFGATTQPDTGRSVVFPVCHCAICEQNTYVDEDGLIRPGMRLGRNEYKQHRAVEACRRIAASVSTASHQASSSIATQRTSNEPPSSSGNTISKDFSAACDINQRCYSDSETGRFPRAMFACLKLRFYSRPNLVLLAYNSSG